MSKYKRDYFEEMNIDYEELKDYKDIETYYDEIQDFTNLLKELQCDRVECQKYIVRANKEIERLNNVIDKLEEKKIPEKLGYFDLTKDKNEKDENANDLELHYTGVADTFDNVYEKINEIIDYLQSKGE